MRRDHAREDSMASAGEQAQERSRLHAVFRLLQDPAAKRHDRVRSKNDLVGTWTNSRGLDMGEPKRAGAGRFAGEWSFVNVGGTHGVRLDSDLREQVEPTLAR
jgi:hypothetical protein